MCGIAGIFRLTQSPSREDAKGVLRMMDAEVHRGPDDWGLLVPVAIATDMRASNVLPVHAACRISAYESSGPGAVLGSRRLSIIDRSERGRMPMGTEDGRYWIVYNGETYNHEALRVELKPRVGSFRSDTDTEVVLRGYSTWGDAVVPRLRGMFAFAVFDAGTRPRLFLARDRFGIKPLYYFYDSERLVFASEVRVLLRSGFIPKDEDLEALVRFLQLGSIPAPQTTVRNVRSLRPGETLTIEAARMKNARYWLLSDHLVDRIAGGSRIRGEDAPRRTRSLLDESVRLHLVSDAPLGMFLSGGIDSSALVALATASRPVTTVSVGFDEPGHTETQYARMVAERYRTDHREVLLRGPEVFEKLPQFFAAMDQPTVDGLNTYMISQAARAVGLTVVLSGIGSDELFLGYRHLRAAARFRRLINCLRALPKSLRRATLETARRVLGPSRDVDKFEYLEDPTFENLYLAARGLFGPRQIQALTTLGDGEVTGLQLGWPQPADGHNLLAAFTLFEFEHYLQNQLLKDADVMGMRHSVEIRVPYLDHLLVQSVLGFPERVRIRGSEQKPLLLNALGADLPREVWDRPKMGFAFPLGAWLRRHGRDLREATFENKRFERRAVADVWAGFEAGRIHWSRPWSLVVLANLNWPTT